MGFNGTNVICLEDKDFKNGILHYRGKPVQGKWVVMVWAYYCGYCHKAMPDFKELAKRGVKGVVFANIRVDGDESERALSAMLPKITKQSMSGVPAYLLFENGKFSAMVVGGQNESKLIEFMN